jgi:hypothetical protein
MIGIGIADSLGVNLSGLNPATRTFISSAGISDAATISAINNLINGLQADGLWPKMKAVYPFVTDNRNIIPYTENLSGWSSQSVTQTTNYAIAPDGTNTAIRVQGTANDWYLGYFPPNTSTSNKVFSVYVKSNTGVNQQFRFFYQNSPVSGNYTATTSWQRLEFTVSTNTTSGQVSGFCRDSSNNTADLLIWHPQAEEGTVATPYQPIATTQQAYIASQFKYNLKDPRDTDAAFRLVFNGGWTFAKTGATPNGTNGYANTFLNPTTALTNYNAHSSVYNRTENANAGWDIGLTNSISGYLNEFLLTARQLDLTTSGFYDYNGFLNGAVSVASATAIGFFNNSVISNTSQKIYKTGNQIAVNTNTNTSTPANGNVFISAVNDISTSTAIAFNSSQKSFATIGNGLTDDEAARLYYRVQVFQTSLGRQIGSPAYALPDTYDANAKLYLSAIGSTTNNTFNNAINTFITGLKTDGIYNKMKAVYPFATDNVNLLSYTEDFGNAYWSINASSVTSNTTTAPNGTTTADTLTENNANNYHTVYVNNFAFANGIGTFSIYVKFNGRKYINLGSNNVSLFNAASIFDISLGTIVSTSSGTASITDVGNGWYRCSISGTTTNGNTPLSLTLLDNSLNGLYTGNGTSGVYIWGAQYETTALTTYQPQLGSAQTYFANQFKYNMVNPQDDDTAFRLVFNGGWTHSPQGALPNGVNAYADSKFVPSSNLTINNQSYSVYSRSNTAAGFKRELSVSNSGEIGVLVRYAADLFYPIIGAGTYPTLANTDSRGYYIANRTDGTNIKGYKDGSLVINSAQTANLPTSQPVYLSSKNNGGTAVEFSDRQLAISTIGDGLSDTEAANLFIRVETLNQALARQVVVPAVSDPDAQAFLNAAVITDPTQAAAINTLTIGLKADGLWTKMKAIYPFVGGTASTHKYNLKDPRDLDAAYRLVFNGGWTHSATGALPNGTNAYADTKLMPATVLSESSAHYSFYSRTNVSQSTYDISAGDHYSLLLYNSQFYTNLTNSGAYPASVSLPNTLGYYIASKTTLSTINGFANNNKVINNVTIGGGVPFNNTILSSRSAVSSFSSKQVALASIGDGLTDLDATNLYNRVNTYQVALSRNV